MSEVTRTVNNNQYLYFIYYDVNGVRKDIYCGPISNPETKKNVIKIEINHLKEQKTALSEKIRKLENDLKQR